MATRPTLVTALVHLVLAACGSGNPDPGTTEDASQASDSSGGGGGGGSDGSITPTGPDPADDGTATVTTSTASIPGDGANRTLTATVFTPSSAGPRPLVVVSPGFQMARAQYTSYSRHLATWGFVVVLTDYVGAGTLPNFPDHAKSAADIPAVITWALAQSALDVDAQKLAVAGHSLGGKLSVFAATLDPRIKAVVGWDPVDSSNPSVAPEKMGQMQTAIAVVGETTNGGGGGMPCAPTADNFATFYAAAPSPAYSLTVTGADHMDWVDDGSCAFCGFCSPGSAAPELARKVTRRVNVAWLRRQLLADTAMDAWLDTPPEASTNAAIVARH